MTTVSVWLLIIATNGSYTWGQVSVLERFPTKEMCQHVAKHIPDGAGNKACVEATIVVKP